MSKAKDLGKGSGERPKNGNNGDTKEVEGYAYCATHKQKCLNDCASIGLVFSYID